MNSKEYNQLITECSRVFRFIIPSEEFLEYVDDLRKIYKRYKSEMDYHRGYPRADLSKAKLNGKDLQEYSKKAGVKVSFFKIGSDPYKFGTHCRFMYQGIDITKIIGI